MIQNCKVEKEVMHKCMATGQEICIGSQMTVRSIADTIYMSHNNA